MPSFRVVPILRLAAVCVALVVAAYVIIQPSEESGSDSDGEPGPAGLSTTTAPPSVFGPIPSGGPGVVEHASGAVLPVQGGGDGSWEVLTPCARTTVVDGPRVTGAHVVLDPGHGGRETGAIGPTGVTEEALNLDIAQRVAHRLREAGAGVVLTRTGDVRVAIETRAAVVEALDPQLFVSIHHNSGPTVASTRPGVQVYHQDGEPEAARLGTLLFDGLQAAFSPFSDTWSAGNAIGVRARLGTDGDDYYGVLRRPAVPAVLIEALYLSSEPEASLLEGDEIREAEAAAIADAVIAWVGTDASGGGQLPTLVADESAGGGGGTTGCEDPAGLTGG